MEKYIESYKITATRGSWAPKRRETIKGAILLAERLRSQGKHGIVEAVCFDEKNI